MLVDIIAFFPFELIFVPFFQNCKITLQKHKAYFATTRMSRYQKPNWIFFFFLFSLKHFHEKEHRKYKHPTFSRSQCLSSCSAKQGFCAVTLERRQVLHIQALERDPFGVPTLLLPLSQWQRRDPMHTSCLMYTSACSDIPPALVFSFKSHTFLKTESLIKFQRKKKIIRAFSTPSPLSPFPKLAP